MTLLVVGAAGQNKARFAEGYADVLSDAHLAVRDMMKAGMSHEEMLASLLSHDAVILDEVGCGVVPIDAFERIWREEVGRLCCALAERAQKVVRIVCGLPQTLKGEKEWS